MKKPRDKSSTKTNNERVTLEEMHCEHEWHISSFII